MATIQLTTERGEALQALLREDPNAKPWDVYPRPQLRREGWINLNGMWEFCALTPEQTKNGEEPCYDCRILVPFPVEAVLSGVGKHFPEGSRLWYRKRFFMDTIPDGRCLLLHIDAEDQWLTAWFNGKRVRLVNTALTGPATLLLPDVQTGENTLELRVRDDLRDRAVPYGKQTRKRGGMWYTPVSGIWQTAWLEWVPERYISELKITPTLTSVMVEVAETTANDPAGAAIGRMQCRQVAGATGGLAGNTHPCVVCEGITYPITDGKAVITPAQPHLWTPEEPYLYEFTVKTETDEVQSYFALRTIEHKVVDGMPRLCLNGKPYFFHALLDQGYWPDGLYTPASPDCYADDILAMKRLGFNTLRKHIKVEPQQFYYDCDRLGMLVLQDMVNNGRYSFFGDTLLPTLGLQRLPQWLPLRKAATKACFAQATAATVRRLYNHPCIVYWTIFNEGWGQFAPTQNYDRLKQLDPTRVIDTTSGWFRGGKTDVESRHVYFRRFRLPRAKRPVVLSEFGGFACKLQGHSFNPDKTYGYRFFKTQEAYMDALEALYRAQIVPAVKNGLCGAVYTQLSDVEDETNGLLTYDRRVCKVERARMQAIAAALRREMRI